MNRSLLPFGVAFILVAAAAGTTHAQTGQSTPSVSSAQSQPPQKVVWTNEELTSLDPHSGVSSVGSDSENTLKRTGPAKTPAANRDARWYRDQIGKLQAKIPPLDEQISKLGDALDGKPTGDGTKSTRPYSVRAGDWSRELSGLQKKRADTLAQIDALRDQARRNKIPPSSIP